MKKPIAIAMSNRSHRLFLNLVMLLALILACIYIFQIGTHNGRLYGISSAEKALSDLCANNREKEATIALNYSNMNIDGLAQNQGFEKAKKIEYIKATQQRVAEGKNY